jgi:hypothetical protein
LKIIVAQKGAREHFAVARALHQQGMLAGLVTDWYAPAWTKKIKGLSSRLSSALAARAEEIPDELVWATPLRNLWWKRKIRAAARRNRLYAGYAETDAAFARTVSRFRLPAHEVFFGYSYASLEMLEVEKQRGKFTLLDQIDPGAMEFQLVIEEMKKYPEVAGEPPAFPSAHFDRARREWKLADVIIVNSEWSRDALISDGADPAKIEVLPLAYEISAPEKNQKTEAKNPGDDLQPLTVLFLGQVNVRKGIHHLVEAARLLEREPVRFVVAGSLDIRREFIAIAPKNIRWHGPVPRSEAGKLYGQADVFVLPTLSDGFAITQLEALAHGLPVITTPNCGRVVKNGETGFIVPARDPQALAEAIMRFVRERSLVAAMRFHCLEAVKTFSIGTFGQRLIRIINEGMARISGDQK